MVGNIRYVINMANSIIGVSILSMPYCFKEVGIVLGILLLLLCGFITKKTCMFLVKSAVMARRRSYELLAFQVFGVTGKLFMELCMILFLLGICISFHVVIGDLAPSIVAKYAVLENTPRLRATLLFVIVLFVILPLCLLRNIDSLASLSACSIGFYVFLNFVIFYAALPKLIDASWIYSADLFHIEKTFNVLPIMLLAMACQSNVFEIYASIPDPDLPMMKSVVNHAINICCALYIGVGFLGYVAFHDKELGGNIIMSFNSSKMTDGITMFFVISLVISFPLMLFPCRTSLHSLIYKRNVQVSSFDSVGNYMPEIRFKAITFSTLAISLVIGIMIPNIEFVLGLLGSTMGMWIALLLPSVFYIRVYTKLSFERLLAQGFMFLGVFLMIMGTYLHLMNFRVTTTSVTMPPPIPHVEVPEVIPQINEPPKAIENPILKEDAANLDGTGRKEPAIPEPPSHQEPEVAQLQVEKRDNDQLSKNDDPLYKKRSSKSPPNLVDKASSLERNVKLPLGGEPLIDKKIKIPIVKKEIKEEDLHPDAIKKEEKENAEEKQGKEEVKDEILEKKQEEILKKLEEHQKEQVKILKVQKEILQELKDQKEKVEVDKNEPETNMEANKDDLNNDILPQQNPLPNKNPENIPIQNPEINIQRKIPHVEGPGNQSPINGENKENDFNIDINQDLRKDHVEQRHIVSPGQYVESHANVQTKDKIVISQPVLNLNKHLKPPPLYARKIRDKNLQDLNRDFDDLENVRINPAEMHHDEERKKRDLGSVILPSHQLNSPEIRLSEKVPEEGDYAKVMGVIYDSRHLLWDSRKVRRRKRKNDQYPEYWEEM